MPEGAPTSALGARSGAPSGLRPSSFVMCNTPVEVQFITSAGCLNYPCRTPVVDLVMAIPGLDSSFRAVRVGRRERRADVFEPDAVFVERVRIEFDPDRRQRAAANDDLADPVD